MCRETRPSDDRGINSVVGVVVLIGITVILASVIGTFAFGMGDQLRDTSPIPEIQLSGEQVETDGIGSGGVVVEAVHESGTTIDGENLYATVNYEGSAGDDLAVRLTGVTREVDAGDRIGVEFRTTDDSTGTIEAGTTVVIGWEYRGQSGELLPFELHDDVAYDGDD